MSGAFCSASHEWPLLNSFQLQLQQPKLLVQVLGSAQKQAEKLAAQKARAKKRGGRGVKWGQMPGANAQNWQLPPFVQQLGAKKDERSVLIIDSRDKRIQSPYQGWLLDEILLNAQSGVNILSDRQLIRSPNSGYHMNLFYVPHHRRLQVHFGWIYDFIWHGSLCQVGQRHWRGHEAPGVPARSDGP